MWDPLSSSQTDVGMFLLLLSTLLNTLGLILSSNARTLSTLTPPRIVNLHA